MVFFSQLLEISVNPLMSLPETATNLLMSFLEVAMFLLLLFLVGWSDAYTCKIPNRYLLGLILLWAAHTVCLNGRSTPFDTLNRSAGILRIISAATIAVLVLFVQALFQLITKRKGIGAGDIKLFFVLTLYLGFEQGLYVVFLSCIFAVLNNVWRIASEHLAAQNVKTPKPRANHSRFPFGPSIVCAAVMIMLIRVVIAAL